MKSKSNFWLALHELACELEKEGRSDSERIEGLLAILRAAPPEVVTAYIENLEIVAGTVGQLLTRAKTL